jgi:outer membrane protein OmpA-like peptidoglycan-associated protein
MASILDNIRDLITPAMVSPAAVVTRDSEYALTTGFSAAIPTILASLAKRSDDDGFMAQLSQLAKGAADSDPVSAATAYMSPKTGGIDVTTSMGAWLSSLFGNNLSSVTDALGQFSGLRRGSAPWLLSIAASFVLQQLGRLMASERLDAAGLASRLRREQDDFEDAIPRGFHVPELASERARSDDTASTRRKAGAFVVPVVATLLALGAAAWFVNRSRPERTAVGVTEKVEKTVGTTGIITTHETFRLLPGTNIKIIGGSMEDRLVAYVASPSASGSNLFDFDRITFMRGSAVPTDVSRDQIERVAAILLAYPSVHVTVRGHADNPGRSPDDAQLAKARAQAVANMLTNAGISLDRVSLEEFDDRTPPIADESFEFGRPQNRRVTLEITER